MARNVHVIPHKKGWAVTRQGSRRVGNIFALKRDAIDAALATTKRSGGEMIVHGPTGVAIGRAAMPSSIDDGQLRAAIRAIQDESKVARRTKANRPAVRRHPRPHSRRLAS